MDKPAANEKVGEAGGILTAELDKRRRHVWIAMSVAVLLAVIFEGSSTHITVLGMTALYLVAKTIVVVGLSLYFLVRRQKPMPELAAAWRSLKILPVAWVASALLAFGINQWRVYETRSFVARAVVALDAYRAKNGHFPSELPLGELGPLPKWLRNTSFVSITNDSFEFRYDYPFSLRSKGYRFDDVIRAWAEFVWPQVD